MSVPACHVQHVSAYEPVAVRAALEAAWERLPGAGGFRPGDRVLIKPNLLAGRAPERAVTTHPVVVEAVAGFLADRNCRLWLGDSPAVESMERVARLAGLGPVMRRLGILSAPLVRGAYRPSRNRRWFPTLYLAEELADFDHVVNVPKFKTHGMMTLTLGVKNLFGCVPGKQKAAYHLTAGVDRSTFARLLLEIGETVNPTLTVLDGVVAMDGDGPNLGRPRPLGLLLVGRDMLAVDATAGALVGVRPDRHPVIAEALAANMAGAKVEVDGPVVGDYRLPTARALQWRLPGFLIHHAKRWWTTLPEIVVDICSGCGDCRRVCPVDAIAASPTGGLRVDIRRCIQCFCCHEVCPADAIRLRQGVGLRAWGAVRGRLGGAPAESAEPTGGS